MNRRDPDHMIRKDPDRGGGRRPLLATFVGNNRQMLNEIRDNLSHLRRNVLEGDGEGTGGGGVQPLKGDLSQSTPNLADKAAVAVPSGPKKGLEYHHKTLAEIRDSLRPFQTVNRGQSGNESETSRQKIQQIMALGVDEDIADQALRLCSNVDNAVALLCRIIEGRNGSSKVSAGLPNYPIIRRPSIESKYGPASPATSDSNSVRSDSPSLSNVSSRQLNGHQTPPPVPPRAPIAPILPARGQTPPPLTTMQMTSEGQQVADVPPGHVQQLIKRMSPGQPAVFRSNLVQPSLQTGIPQAQTSPSPVVSGVATGVAISGSSQPWGVGTVTGVSSRQGHNHAAGVISSSLAQQLQKGMVLSHSSPTSSPGSGSSSTSSTPAPSGPRVTINLSHPLPPPYSQTGAGSNTPATTTTLLHISGEQSHMLGAQMADYLAMTSSDSPISLSTTSSSGNSAMSDGSMGAGSSLGMPTGMMVPGLPVHSTRRPMGSSHAPIIMQSVKSKEVHKPVPQTATAPLSSPPALSVPSSASLVPCQHNYISQVQAQVNVSASSAHVSSSTPAATSSSGSATTHTRNVQIQITRHPPYTHNHQPHLQTHNGGIHYASEPLPPQASTVTGRPTIQIHIPGGSGGGMCSGVGIGHGYAQNHVHIHNFGGVNYDFYQRTPSDTTSTPRSDSPVSRTTNQSPLSVLSTTSSPSTNSDIPDKPPPPYPFSLHGGQRQPPIPPRIPLQVKPPPPPPPTQHGITVHLHSKPLPSSLPSSAAPQMVNTSAGQPVIVSQSPLPTPMVVPVNGQNGNIETASDQGEDTDSETISSSEVGATTVPEKHRCLSPMPQRKPEARERDKLRRDTKVRIYSPQAFKFYMEQHVENVLKIHQQRMHRRMQLENEMAKVHLSEEAARQMRRMLHQKESNYIRLKRAKMDKAMFEKLKTLGVGAFGEVALVRKKDTGMLYAMKTLRKADVLKRNQVAHVKAERDILAEADNEWVVKLYYSFQDQHNLYFVMDYVPGGDLMGLLIRLEILEEPLAQFYVAELVQAIDSVHRMGFIHRDIKPDNILIDRDGHIKLTDFGLCTGFRWTHNSKYYQRDGAHARQDSMEVKCQLDEQCQCHILKPLERRKKREQRCLAHSLVGTPNYIAPEVLMRSAGYTSVCDWWSVGVILFEMLVGHPPFYASSPAETQYKVINWKETLKIPREANLSQAATDLILRLCCGPEERLGVNGAAEIKAHPFFAGLNMDGLRRQKPPYVPNIRYATDTSNFDPVDPGKLHNDSEEGKKMEKLENGKHPEHAFFEFTFRRFFDDGGHPCANAAEEPDSNSPVYV